MNRNLIKKELFTCLIHPLFYITAVLFTFFCAAQFFFGQQFFIAGAGSTDLHRFFEVIPYVCILVLPALCMRNANDDYDVMYPVSDAVRITSRWAASLAAFLLMLLPLVLVPVCITFFGDADAGQTAAGFTGIIFYAAAAAAFAVFVSEAVPQHAASFLITAAVLAAVNSIHLLPLYIPFPPAVSWFVKAVSFAWHFDAAGKGIIDTRDIVFYICTAACFLMLAVAASQHKKGFHFIRHPSVNGIRTKTLLTAAVIILALFDSSRYYLRFDLTKGKQFSVSSYSRALLNTVDEPLRITYYRSDELVRLYPQVRDVYDYLLSYSGQNSRISVTVQDPSGADVQNRLASYGITGQQIQTTGKNKTEYVQVYSAVVIEYLSKTEVLPFVLSASTLEYDLDIRVQRLVQNISRTVSVLCGNGLSADSDYQYVKPWLESQGFICSILNGTDTLEGSDSLLAVFGSSKLTEQNAADIERFVAAGGRALFAVSPYTADLTGDWSITASADDKLLPLLNAWGFEIGSQLVADISCAQITLYADESDTPHTEQVNYPLWLSILPQQHAVRGMTLYWASPVMIYSRDIQPLIVSSTSAWLMESDKNSPSRLFETNPFLVPKTGSGSDTSSSVGQYTLAAELQGKIPGYYYTDTGTDSKVIVVADQYFTNSLMMSYTAGEQGDYRNLEFLTSSLLDLRGENELAGLLNRTAVNTSLYKITDESEFSRTRTAVLIITLGIVPLLFICAAAAVQIKRRKRK